MQYYAGLDVSLKETFVSIIDEKGKIIKEAMIETDVEKLADYLLVQGLEYHRIGIESGQMSIFLCKGLIKKNLPIICIDARHASKILSNNINKNDKNDARGIAQIMRAELYREVKVKSDESCETKVLLGSRRQLVNTRQQVAGTVRGLLKIYGIKVKSKGQYQSFVGAVRGEIEALESKKAIEAILVSLETINLVISELDADLRKYAKKDKDCQLLMTVPGIGAVTAATYKAALDEPGRFRDSETVGAYMGLTPKQYASGETNRHGSISKMGPGECRSMLYEAAQSLLVVSKQKTKIQTWGLKIAKKKGMKKAIVAVARKLAVTMHRMLVDQKEFCNS